MSATQILEDLKNGKHTVDEAQELLAQLKLKDLKKIAMTYFRTDQVIFIGFQLP